MAGLKPSDLGCVLPCEGLQTAFRSGFVCRTSQGLMGLGFKALSWPALPALKHPCLDAAVA